MIEHKRIRRSAAVVDSTPVAGNVVKVQDPKALSLVASPSNQTPFRVIRSKGAEPMADKQPKQTKRSSAPRVTARRVSRNSAVNPILRLSFPEGTTEDGVNTILDQFGMQDGYNVTEDNGVYLATRSDLQSIAQDAVVVPLTPEGIVAYVSRTDNADEVPAEADKIVLVAVELDLTKITRDDATQWLKDNGMEADLSGDAEAVTVARSDVAETVETRSVEVAPGISMTIARDDGEGDYQPVPDGYIAVVSEAAYGSWGWGQLDFSAAMADIVFSEKVREGLNTLEDVLRQIMFWSPLPIATRKTLVNNALSQFGIFVNSHMDMLPRQVVVSVSRSDKPSGETEMKQPATTTQRTDAAPGTAAPAATTPAATNAPAATTAPAADDVDVTIKRSELTTMVADAVTAALAKRADDEAAAAAAAEAAKAAAPITRSDLTTAIGEAVTTANAALIERMDKLEGKTVVRSDAGDGTTTDTTKRNDGDVFAGSLPGIVRRSAK